jgi:hypothetical protein
LLLGLLAAQPQGGTWFAPGKRTTMLAHNPFPSDGKWTDRLDRALGAGTPSVIEIDLVWRKDPKTGEFRSFVPFSRKLTGDEPDISRYFFPKVRPIVEKALKSGDRRNWPLVVLFLDIKDTQPEHLEVIWKQLGEYESWLTTAVKTADPARQSPLELKPMMVVVNDKPGSNDEEVFFNRVPVGGKLRIFGGAPTFAQDPAAVKAGQPRLDPSTIAPEKYFLAPAGNFRRWVVRPWDVIEKGGVAKSEDWTPAEEQRLKAIVGEAHKSGYLFGFYHLNGHAPDAGQGWEDASNFGSVEKGKLRWNACIKAGADFISTDQYEDVAELIRRTPR